jgi:RimJ/RimL family protein N-acetyltransferase
MQLETRRLRLCCWREAHRDAFAAMHADPEVMIDHGYTFSRAESDQKFDRYALAFQRNGVCRWAVESRDGEFLGYTGIMLLPPEHPLGPQMEIGWRLVRRAWGNGYATEAAQAALDDAFGRVRLNEVLAFTTGTNLRSQAVMARLQLRRDPSRDFTFAAKGRTWHQLVWVARPVRP